MGRFVKDRNYQWIIEDIITSEGHCDYEDLYNHISAYFSSDEIIEALEDYINYNLDMDIDEIEESIDSEDADIWGLVYK